MTAVWWVFLLLVPVAGIHLWAAHRWHGAILWWESAVGVLLAALTAWGCIALGQLSVGHDTETISGSAYKAVYQPEWKSNETRTESYTTGSGNNRTTRTRTVRYVETHAASYELHSDIGTFGIGESTWETLAQTHGSAVTAHRGHRPNYRSGDRDDYHMDLSRNGGGDEELAAVGLGTPDFPVTRTRSWVNRLEHSDSLLRLPALKEGEAERLGLPDYPEPPSSALGRTGRIVGAGGMDPRGWDRLNALLGPSKRVNLILVYLGDGSTVETAMKLRQHWRNGKKNDLVLCVDKTDAAWSYVFGWASSDLPKQSVATALRQGPVDTSRIPDIWSAVWNDFQPYDWTKVDRIPLKVPYWSIVVALIVTAVAQYGFIRWATANEFQ